MSVYLYRLARWCFHRRRIVLSAWLLVAIALVAVAQLSGGKTSNAFTIPGTESQQVASVLEAKLPAASGASTQVVFATSKADITSTADQKAIDRTIKQLAALPQVTTVSNPYQAKAISPDRHLALATVYYNAQAANVKSSTVDKLEPAVAAARSAGVEVEFSGAVYPTPGSGGSSEGAGLLIALAGGPLPH